MTFEIVDGSIVLPARAVRVASHGNSLDFSGRYTLIKTTNTVRIRNWWLPAIFDITISFTTGVISTMFPTFYSDPPCLVHGNRIYLVSNVGGFKISIYDMQGNLINILGMPPLPPDRLSVNYMTLGVYNNIPVLVRHFIWRKTVFIEDPEIMEVWKIGDNRLSSYFDELIYSGERVSPSASNQNIFNYGNGNFGVSHYSFNTPDLTPQAIWCSTGEFFINSESILAGITILPSKITDITAPIFIQNSDSVCASNGGFPTINSPLVNGTGGSPWRINSTTRIVESTTDVPIICYSRGFPVTLKMPLSIRDNVTGGIVSVPTTGSSSNPWTNGSQFGLTFIIGSLYYLFYGSYDDELTQPLNNYTRLL